MTEKDIRTYLGETAKIGRLLQCFPQLTSTNDTVKGLGRSDAPEGLVVLADGQTGGRGRMGRSFDSPAGQGLYLTVLLRPTLPPERLLPLTALAGVAVCDAVERLCGVRPGLKWPNDPVLAGRKLCGVLTELGTDDRGGLFLALGVGLNVFQRPEDFPPELRETAGSLAMAGHTVDRAALAAALIEALDRMYAALLADDLAPWLAAYRRDCVNLGKTVQLLGTDGSRVLAEALDIDEGFGLVVRYPDGREEVIRSGEVSVRGLYGYIE